MTGEITDVTGSGGRPARDAGATREGIHSMNKQREV